jgi:hypothetical protein
VTGSDSLIHGLARLQFASQCLADAAQSLDAAADHGLFTDDLFYHQAQAANRLRRLQKDERAGLPPDLPESSATKVQVFQPEDDGIPERYRSHPTDYMREQNAKRVYIRSPQDDRSPWLLFGSLAELKTEVTAQFYRHGLGRKETYDPKPAAEVQHFIDAEHAETTYDPKYHGLFDDRFINPGNLKDVPKQPWPREELTAWLATWPPADLQQQVKAYHERQGEYHLLGGLQSGDLKLKGKTFTFRDQQCSMQDVDRLFKVVDKELDSDIETFVHLDRQAFLAHLSLARLLDGGEGSSNGREANLLERYHFHMAVQGLLQGMLAEQNRLQAILAGLSENAQTSEQDFIQVCNEISGVHKTLTTNLEDAKDFKAPSLTNVPAGSSLYDLIVDRGDTALPPLSGNTITGEWLGKLVTRLEGVLSRVKRIHFKSLGSLLAFQEKLADEWKSVSELPKNVPSTPAAANAIPHHSR